MPFHIIQGDITKLSVDAIVNAANNSLLGGGGVDGAIHRAAGPRLLEECRGLNGCKTGEAKITGGYDLPAKYVIHTVGPIWRGGRSGEPELLASAYRNSLILASENDCESVAFPLISSGVYGYPLEQALDVAVSTIRGFLEEHEMDVTLVIFSKDSFRLDVHLYSEISGYIRDCQMAEGAGSFLGDAARSAASGGASEGRRLRFPRGLGKSTRKADLECAEKREWAPEENALDDVMADEAAPIRLEEPKMCMAAMAAPAGLKEALENLDESFSQALLRMIDERGMKDSECYKKANIDRKLFSKIRSDIHYRPSKQTVLAFAVALELDLPETEALLKKAGFALSHSNKSDVIVEYFITNRKYDIYSINEALFAFDQNLLGA